MRFAPLSTALLLVLFSAVTALGQGYGHVEGLLWHRIGSGDDQALALDTDPEPDDEVVLETDDLDLGFGGGIRALLGWRDSGNTAWELGYFGVFSFDAEETAIGTNNLALPGDLGANSNNFLNARGIEARYLSRLHNAEFNRVVTDYYDFGEVERLFGARLIVLNEDFTLRGDDSDDEGFGVYDIEADNYLYGGQIGARVTRYLGGWSLQGVGKLGVFLNHASQSQTVLDSPDVMGFPFELRPRAGDSDYTIAGLAEFGVNALRHLDDVWTLRIGYTGIIIGGVALAPEQLDFSDEEDVSGERLDDNGWLFLHGLSLGLEAAW